MFNMKLILLESPDTYLYKYEKCNDNIDDVTTIIEDICDIFEESKKIHFIVSGFGQENWPVDCRYDLLSVIEQLPEIIKNIKNNNFEFNLYFYEQGIERKIEFIDKGNYVESSCYSYTNWEPNPKQIVMNKTRIKEIIFYLYKEFLLYSGILCNNLTKHILFKKWIIQI